MGYRKKRTTKTTWRKKSKKRSSKKRSGVKKLIRREIARQTENKCIQHYDFDQRLYTIGNVSFPTDNVFPLGPDAIGLVLDQGPGQGERIGNKVRTKSLMFKGTLCCLPYDGTFNPQPQPLTVKLWIFYDKTTPTATPNVQAAGDFFQFGDSVKGFQGDLTDQWSPVNTDRYRVVTTRTFKLGYASFNSGTGGVPTYGNFANNDYKLNCSFSINLSKYYPKVVTFRDGSTTPSSRGLWAMFTYAPANGGVLSPTYYCAGLQWMQNFVYEDA